MAHPTRQPLEEFAHRSNLAARLLTLYRREQDIYRRVLALSEEQGTLIRQGAEFGSLRAILEQKNRCLAVIAKLEQEESTTRSAWERDREGLPAAERATVHRALQAVADLIERILACEEENDNELIRRTGVL